MEDFDEQCITAAEAVHNAETALEAYRIVMGKSDHLQLTALKRAVENAHDARLDAMIRKAAMRKTASILH
jgi:hypothetical protein